jgi:hypothetical protein
VLGAQDQFRNKPPDWQYDYKLIVLRLIWWDYYVSVRDQTSGLSAQFRIPVPHAACAALFSTVSLKVMQSAAFFSIQAGYVELSTNNQA